MSINNKLISFAQKELVLGRSDAERNQIDRSLSHLEFNLSETLGNEIIEFVRFGSYTRNTILPRKFDKRSDVDLMVVFDTSDHDYTFKTYRKWLHKVLDKRYPRSPSKKDFPVVKLELKKIIFDIVPAKSNKSWFGSTNYFIPDRDGDWMSTKPNDINSDLSQVNQDTENNVVRHVIRLMKHWNASAGYPFQSYLMEKEIIDTFRHSIFFNSFNSTYEHFISVLNEIAGKQPGVKQALKNIKYYQGNIFRKREEEKELQWMKKLLPELR